MYDHNLVEWKHDVLSEKQPMFVNRRDEVVERGNKKKMEVGGLIGRRCIL